MLKISHHLFYLRFLSLEVCYRIDLNKGSTASYGKHSAFPTRGVSEMSKPVPLGTTLSVHGYFVVNDKLGPRPFSDLMVNSFASKRVGIRFMHSPVEAANLSQLNLGLGGFKDPSLS
jgi:hypothetical protein